MSCNKMRRFITALVLISVLFYIDAKPALDEEKRNLCEGESDLAGCIKEVEEAKATPTSLIPDIEDKKNEEPEEDDHYEMMMKQEQLIKKMVSEDQQNRAYWDEEYKSMNKWARYGIA